MTQFHVLIHAPAPAPHIARLTERHPDVTFTGCRSHSELASGIELHRPDALYTINFSSDRPYPRDAVLADGGPRWISVGGSGTDHLQPWDPAQITVTNSAGVAADVMAEYVIGSLLYFSLDIPGLRADQARQHWQRDREMTTLSNQTLLIVGLGQTGRRVAERAKAMGLTVIGTRANPRPTPPCDEVHAADQLSQLWPRADCIAICTPRLKSTMNLIDDPAFRLMKKGAVLVNVARGGVVNETALADALTSNHLKGAASDVFATEPLPEDSPLWDIPNLLISPHASGVYKGWEDKSVDMFADNLTRFLENEPLSNVVDPARGY